MTGSSQPNPEVLHPEPPKPPDIPYTNSLLRGVVDNIREKSDYLASTFLNMLDTGLTKRDPSFVKVTGLSESDDDTNDIESESTIYDMMTNKSTSNPRGGSDRIKRRKISSTTEDTGLVFRNYKHQVFVSVAECKDGVNSAKFYCLLPVYDLCVVNANNVQEYGIVLKTNHNQLMN